MANGERPDAAADLLPMVYTQLRCVAGAMLAREKPGQTLQPTALVHEAWLRLVGNDHRSWAGRKHFFGAATEAMRRILIDQARRKARVKHGGEQQRIDAAEAELAVEAPCADALQVDEVLQKLEAADPRLREIVNLRYFGGFTVPETAELLGVSVATVEREWRFVRAWLRDELGD